MKPETESSDQKLSRRNQSCVKPVSSPAPSAQKTTASVSGQRTRRRVSYPAFIPGRVARLRRQRHLTQRQVAACLGVRQQTYNEFEHGRSSMHIEEFIRLARLFNVSVDFITGASNVIGEFPRI